MWRAKRHTRRRSARAKGFATIEVLVTVAIVMLIGTISILALGRSDRAVLQSDVASIALALQQARLQAAETGQPVEIEYTQDDQTLRAGVTAHTLTQGVTSPNETARIFIRPSGENEGLDLLLVVGDHSRSVELDWLTGQIRLSR
jgi:Tfp pilus assembly protein FimT